MKFRKKPVVIEAIRFTGGLDSAKEVIAFASLPETAYVHLVNDREYVHIDTLEGTMCCDRGDWVIKGVKGEFYPCKPDIFQTTYEAVDE